MLSLKKKKRYVGLTTSDAALLGCGLCLCLQEWRPKSFSFACDDKWSFGRGHCVGKEFRRRIQRFNAANCVSGSKSGDQNVFRLLVMTSDLLVAVTSLVVQENFDSWMFESWINRNKIPSKKSGVVANIANSNYPITRCCQWKSELTITIPMYHY